MMSNTDHDQDMPVQGRHGQGMETLSALFDGELQGDAARFAMKRLGHDPQWRQAVGNWQLLGDALRGQASTVAPGGFAARVAAAVSAEPVAVAVPVVASAAVVPAVAMPAAAVSRRRWLGGAALAASVAMVAMLVARPFSQDSSTASGSVTLAQTELATVPIPIPAPAEAAPASPDAALQVGAAAIAVAEVRRRAGERRSRGQSQRVALRASKRHVAVPAIASTATATALAIAEPASHTSSNPFRPQPVEVVSRPWPRAVLPGSPATGAFTASYGTGSASSPSFYPFEPRLPNVTDAAAVPINADERRR